MADLSGTRIAVLAASGSDQLEFEAIRDTLARFRAGVAVVSPKKEALRAWRNKEWGDDFAVDVPVLAADPGDYHGLVIPGGLIGADTLRSDEAAITLVRQVRDRGRPVAALGHATWVLIEAGAARGRTLTGIEAVRTDIDNAGGRWVNDVVHDRGVITGRHRDDVGAVMTLLAEALLED